MRIRKGEIFSVLCSVHLPEFVLQYLKLAGNLLHSIRDYLGDVTAHGRAQEWLSRKRLGTRLRDYEYIASSRSLGKGLFC